MVAVIEAEGAAEAEADLRATGVEDIPRVTRIPVAVAVAAAEAILVVPVETEAIPAEGRINLMAGGTIQAADKATPAETRGTTTADEGIPAETKGTTTADEGIPVVDEVITAVETGTITAETAVTITVEDGATDGATMMAASIQIGATIMVDNFGRGLTLELESAFPSDTAIIPIRDAATTTA